MTDGIAITIPGFDELTKQQMFDMSAKHIGSTGVQSRDSDGNCVYGGNGCAAAPFLTEEGKAIGDERTIKAQNSMAESGGGWWALTKEQLVSKHNSDFICRLQDAHDTTPAFADNDEFHKNYDSIMRNLAREHNLNTEALDALGWAQA